MTCVEPNHFDDEGGSVTPQPWTQYRQIATAYAASRSGTYPPTGGGDKNEQLQAVGLFWTNDAPISQLVYGIVTRGGATMALQARSRAYMKTYHALGIGGVGTTPQAFVAGRFGTGLDVGSGGLLGTNTAYGISEIRQHSHSMPLVPQRTGWLRVDPGVTIHAAVQLFFLTEFWENTPITGGDASTGSSYVTGDTRIDLFAVPVL